MGLRINQNIAAMNAYRNLSVTDGQMSKSLEKLSSGFRINRAADDAAGLSISEGLRAQIGGLKVAVRNSQDAISVVQTAEGALTETQSILQRMRDLAVQAANTGSQDPSATAAAQTEFAQLNKELDRIGNTTSFGQTKLLNGTFGTQATAATATAVTVDSSTGANFSASTLNLAGTTIGGGTATATATTVALTGFDVDKDGVALAAGNYNNAAHLQRDLQTAVDDAMVADVGALPTYERGDVKVKVTDDGEGAWTVSLSSNATGATTATGAALAVIDGGAGFGFTAASTSTAVTLSDGGKFQIGANKGESMGISIGAVNSTTLGTEGLDLNTQAAAAVSRVSAAIDQVSTTRAELGAYQNRFEHTINNLNVAVENLSASESRIRDTDMAQEMVSFTRSQILSQAGTAMLAQANQAPQSVLSLLRG